MLPYLTAHLHGPATNDLSSALGLRVEHTVDLNGNPITKSGVRLENLRLAPIWLRDSTVIFIWKDSFMAPIPYLLYFPITDFSFSFFSFSFSAFLPWIALAAFVGVVLWLMNRELQKDIRSQWEEQIILGHLEGYSRLFTPHGNSLRTGVP